MYEESMSAPLLAYLPDAVKNEPRGKVSSQLVHNVDYTPALLEVSGVAIPSDIQIQLFLPLLKGEDTAVWRENKLYLSLFRILERTQCVGCGRHIERCKLVYCYGHDIDSRELYDIKNDPHEMTKLYFFVGCSGLE